jgi:transposase
MPAAKPVHITPDQERELARIASAKTSAQRDVFRARIILGLSAGKTHQEIATELTTSLQAVSRWRNRWVVGGLADLRDAPGRGRKPSVAPKAVRKAISLAGRPSSQGEPWSVRSMAKETGLSKSSVQRLWASHGIQPHRVRSFKLSTDVEFEEKFWDVVGLYLNPPDQAVVLCCDEKSQCQALERTQPGLPLKQGHIQTRTHDYYRHGTVTLFAALDYLSGKIFAHTAPRHRHREWLAFLQKIDAEVPAHLDIHIICDNYATHKHPKVGVWLRRHRRFHLHFTPTSSSWLNLVERFFGELTRKVIRPGSFRSVGALVSDILRYLERRNKNPKPYRWTATPEKILAKIDRAWEALLEEVYHPIYGTSH